MLKTQPRFPAITIEAAPADVQILRLYISLWVEDVAGEIEHLAIYRDVVASMNVADIAKVVGESFVG